MLDPDIVFLIFVPPLVHAAAYRAGHKRLIDRAEELAILAIGLVAVTIVAAAAVAHALVDGMTWPAAFALGAAIAPTDAIAATAVFRRLGAPERVLSVVEGESLVNDATGLVTLRLAIAAGVAGTFCAWHGVGEFFWVSLAGVAVGALGGWIASWLRQRIDDSLIEITVTLLTPYAVYVAAEDQIVVDVELIQTVALGYTQKLTVGDIAASERQRRLYFLMENVANLVVESDEPYATKWPPFQVAIAHEIQFTGIQSGIVVQITC